MNFWKVSLALIVCTVDLVVSYSYSGPSVKINDTAVQGLYTDLISDNGMRVAQYLGIPYAPQPVRFKLATPLVLTNKTLDATTYGPTCYQVLGSLGNAVKLNSPVESEDCLSLNIWTSISRPYRSHHLPVLLWIYGGGFVFGGTDIPVYNGSVLATHDHVVVSINYRTNVFGFPSSTAVPLNETNLGLLDMRLALKWVHANIANFGGDANRITLFGQSAGSFAVDSFILEGPAKNPPFHAAILESGTLLPPRPTERGTIFNQLAKGVGCNQPAGSQTQLECVQKVPGKIIHDVQSNLDLSLQAVVDNQTIYLDTFARRTSHKIAEVPILIGTTADEGTVFEIGQNNFTEFVIALSPLLVPILPFVDSLYPIPSVYPTDNAAISALFRDVGLTCPTSITAALSDKYVPTYRYLFNATFLNTAIAPGLGAYHSAELPLVFGTYPTAHQTAQEVALSTYMQGVWTGFSRNPRRGPWPQYGSFKEDIAYIGVNGSSGATMLGRKPIDRICKSFWNGIEAPGYDLTFVNNFT